MQGKYFDNSITGLLCAERIQVVFSGGFILVRFVWIFTVTEKALFRESNLSAKCQVPALKRGNTRGSH